MKVLKFNVNIKTMMNEIKFRDLPKNIKQAVIKAQKRKAYSFYPIFLLYGFSLIGLIKFAQLIFNI